MFGTSVNEVVAFIIGAGLGLIAPAALADVRRAESRDPVRRASSNVWSLVYPPLLFGLAFQRQATDALQALVIVNAIVGLTAAAWVLVLDHRRAAHGRSRTWVSAAVPRLAGLLSIVTALALVLNLVHRRGMPTMTPDRIGLALSGLAGVAVGVLVPVVPRDTPLSTWLGRHIFSRMSAFRWAMIVLLGGCGGLAYALVAILPR